MTDQETQLDNAQGNHATEAEQSPGSKHTTKSYDLWQELQALVEQLLAPAQRMQKEAQERGDEALLLELKQLTGVAQELATRIHAMAESGVAPAEVASAQKLEHTWPSTPSSAATKYSSSPPDPAEEVERILVVDDNEPNREILARSLRKRGFDAIVASGGREALKKLQGQRFDLVVLDVMMPEMDGMEVLKAIRQEAGASDLPVIMATARDDAEDVVRALKLGANDYVSKALDFAVVLARIETQLMVKRANDQVRRLNRRLEESQDKISRLLDSSSLALLDLAGWARWIGDDIARSVGARGLSVWVLEGERLSLLTGDGTNPPSLQEIHKASQSGRVLVQAEQTTIPMRSLSGDLLGGITLAGDKAVWDETELALLRSFAHQVGSALELKRAHQALAQLSRKMGAGRSLPTTTAQPVRVCPQCRRCYDHTREKCVDDGAALDPSFTLPYRLAERYRVRRLLGAGGIGTVFEARDERLDRNVAIKVVRVEHAVNSTLRARFEKEARILAKIASPGVTTVYDSGQLADGSHYIVMERLYGADLETVLHYFGRGRPSQVSQLLRQAGHALSSAHKAGLIHRDLKPGNLFLMPDPKGLRVKILDFGLAKEVNGRVQLTHAGDVLGTPAFMSPEQMLSKPIDARSDIYSFAAVGYEALTHHPVAPGTAQLELFESVVLNMPPPPSSWLSGLPRAIDEAFLWALQKDPKDRPGSVEEWLDTFVDILDTLTGDCRGWPEGRDLLVLADPRRESAGTQSTG